MNGCGASWRWAPSSGSKTWCDDASSSSSPCWRGSRRDLNPTEESGRPPRRRDPLVLLAGLVLVFATGAGLYLAGVPLHPAQQITAAAFVLLGVAAVALAPVNGLVLLYLLPPLFNGEDSRPYFFLLEILVSLTILAGFGARLWRRQPLVVPGGPFLALFCVSALLSMPGNLNEVWLELQVASWSQISEEIRRSDLHSNLFYIRTVLNVGSGAALCVLAASRRWSRAEIVRLAGAATLLYVGVTLVGLWVHWLALLPPGHLVTVGYGWDTEQQGFAGLGFNVSYFAQYALAYLPVAALLLLESPLLWARGAAVLALVLTPYTIGQTGQRGAYIVFMVEAGLLLWALRGVRPETGRRTVAASMAVAGLLGTAAAFLLLGAHILARLRLLWEQGDRYRMEVLDGAWRMFREHPLLGVGSGTFARAFSEHNPDPEMRYGSLSAHNLYAQLLAEQGLLGLLSFLAVLALAVGPLLRVRRPLDEKRSLIPWLLVSLAAWLIYGLLQYTFLMRSMQVYFWITLGLVVSLGLRGCEDIAVATARRCNRTARGRWFRPGRRSCRRHVPPIRLERGRSALWATVAVLGVLAGLRGYAEIRQPLRPGVAVGVHAWEDGKLRWTQGGAAFVVPVEGSLLRLSVACPLISFVGRPQSVELWLDGAAVGRTLLETPDWRVIEVPVHKPRGSRVVLRLRTGYTAIPAALGVNADGRRLGLLIRPIEWAR